MSRSFELKFRDLRTHEVTDAPREWRPAMVVLPAPVDRWETVEVLRGQRALQVSLRVIDGQRCLTADWERAGCGHYPLTIRAPAGTRHHRVTIRPEKISDAAFERLLVDLSFGLPAEIAHALDPHGAHGTTSAPHAAEVTLAGEIERLRRIIAPGEEGVRIRSVVRAIARDPHAVLVGETAVVARERVRFLDVAALPRVMASAGNLDAHGEFLRLPDRRPHPTLDVYEHRLLRSLLEQLAHRIEALSRIGRVMGNPTLISDLAGWRAELSGAWRDAPWLAAVGSLRRATLEPTQVMLRRPQYRAVLDALRTLRTSSLARLETQGEDTALESLPSLYQSWATLKSIHALLVVAADLGYTVVSQRMMVPDREGCWVRVLRDNHAVIELARGNVRATLTPERTFGPAGRLRSVSFPQRPDVVLEVSRPAGTELLVLDPKYKLSDAPDGLGDGQPVKADIDKMHAYRDAIRDASGRRVVAFAAILYPGQMRRYGDDIAAIQAVPGDDALHGELTEVFRRALA